MKVINILKNQKPSLSFEVFPPKKETSIESVGRAVQAIAAIKPAYMSVTYGAGGGTSKYTLEIAKSIKIERSAIRILVFFLSIHSSIKNILPSHSKIYK